MTELKHLSTTALARAIGKDSKELFILLANSGWMIKADGHWRLTEKGRFEGGEYINHPKFGEYIVWPETVKSHAVLSLLPEAPLSATSLAKTFHVAARLINLVLCERGWIKRHVRGWHITPAGQALGGQQQESEAGIPYVTWPETLLKHVGLKHALDGLCFNDKGQPAHMLDGHPYTNPACALVNNWLYVAGMSHAINYALDVITDDGVQHHLQVDFYLPAIATVIMVWPANSNSGKLAKQLETRELLEKSHWSYIEIEEQDLARLDDILSRELLKRNLAVY